MSDIAAWVALAATCIAALMTASNLGAKVTGWGFVVFTIGAVAWIVVGASTGQPQLLWSNIFLGLVDLFGIWRWLGREARFSDTTRQEEARSRQAPGADLFAVSGLCGMAVRSRNGTVVAHVVDAMATCRGAGVDYLIVREGGVAGVGETLRKLAWRDVRVADGSLETGLREADILRLPVADTGSV